MSPAPEAPGRGRFSPLEYRDPRPRPWLIHLLSGVNRHLILRGLMKLRRFDLPAADRDRLERAVNAGTAAFLGPNHPEFLTDWMIDKEISTLVSPLMAHWASYEIVNGTPLTRAFWLANNLIANVPGGGGKAYSQRWATLGHGVLLHPEGTATWQVERVGTLLPGIADMAWDTARSLAAQHDPRGVYLVPILWRLHFTRDVSRGLVREIATIERGLGLPAGSGALPDRFGTLLANLLRRQCERLALPAPGACAGRDYFDAQSAVIAQLRDALAGRYGTLDADLTRAQFQLRKAMRERQSSDPDGVKRDRLALLELMRLASLDPALDDQETLTQERIAEVLKRTRSSLLVRGTRNAIANIVPIAVGPRDVHVRVAEPIDVRSAFAACPPGGEEQARAALLALHHGRLQSALDVLGAELAPVLARNAVRNPVWSRQKLVQQPGAEPAGRG